MTPVMIVPHKESSGFFIDCPSCLIDAWLKKKSVKQNRFVVATEGVTKSAFSW
jgi:hypothetical protein